MTPTSGDFKRVIIGLHQGVLDPSAIRLAAEFAGLLRLDLFGLFVEDPSVRALAGLPFARELQPLGGGWRSIDVERLGRELEAAARKCERMFEDIVRTLQLPVNFEIARGAPEAAIGAVSQAGDIVVVVAPTSAAERVTHQFSRLIDAAFQSAAAVLLIPDRIAHVSGPIVAIAASPNDASIGAGRAIAAAADEDLIVLEAYDESLAHEAVRSEAESGAPIGRRRPVSRQAFADLIHMQAIFDHPHERLVIMTRGAFDENFPSMIASVRHVPVLVLESTENGRKGVSGAAA